jgi:hypothetical protein
MTVTSAARSMTDEELESFPAAIRQEQLVRTILRSLSRGGSVAAGAAPLPISSDRYKEAHAEAVRRLEETA